MFKYTELYVYCNMRNRYGVLKLHANGEVHELKARDCIWLPKGTELIYEAESALIHFAIYPSNWHEVE